MQITKKEVFAQVRHMNTLCHVETSEVFALLDGFESDNPKLQIMQTMVETGEISKEELSDFADELAESDRELDLIMGDIPVILTGVSNG